MIPQDAVSLAVNLTKRAAFQPNQVVQVDRVQIEFEVRIVTCHFQSDGGQGFGGEQDFVNVVSRRVMVWIHVTAHLKKAQLLVRPADEGGGSLAVWHDHDPVVSSQKVQQAG